MTAPVLLYRDGFPTEPGLDTAISRILLEDTSLGALGDSVRVFIPGRIVAFGKRDTLQAGYESATQAARDIGFVPVTRLAGGRAAVFHEGTVAFGLTTAAETPRSGVDARFAEAAQTITDALRGLGVDARIGEVPGEYCPGRWSVHGGGRAKLVGIGQRLGRNAAYVGGVIVVAGARVVNDALIPVNRALGIVWSPEATGAVEDEVPGVTPRKVADAVVAAFAAGRQMTPASFDPDVVSRARQIAGEHAGVL